VVARLCIREVLDGEDEGRSGWPEIVGRLDFCELSYSQLVFIGLMVVALVLNTGFSPGWLSETMFACSLPRLDCFILVVAHIQL
jgi:hypothetical protein